MKAIVIILSSMVTLCACQQSRQEQNVPDVVQDAFKKMHPNPGDLEWVQESGIFEAKFKDGAMTGAVSFNLSGEVVETEEVIRKEQLPDLKGIEEFIKTNYPGAILGQCERIVDHNAKTVYEVQIKGKELVFNDAGKFLEEEPY